MRVVMTSVKELRKKKEKKYSGTYFFSHSTFILFPNFGEIGSCRLNQEFKMKKEAKLELNFSIAYRLIFRKV